MNRFVALLLVAAVVAPALGSGAPAQGARWGAGVEAPAEPAAATYAPLRVYVPPVVEPRAPYVTPGVHGFALAAARGASLVAPDAGHGRIGVGGAGVPCAGDGCLPCLPTPPPVG